MSVELSGSGMVGLSRDALTTLHAALFRDAAANAPAWLQEAGYAAGPGLFAAFTSWCAGRGLPAPETLGASEFGSRAAEFLSALGWGEMHVESLQESAIALDSPDWAEASASSGMQYPGCYFSAGMLADFLGRIANAQLVAMEVECRSVGHARCRFLVASAETIQHVYDGMVNGVAYEESLAAMA